MPEIWVPQEVEFLPARFGSLKRLVTERRFTPPAGGFDPRYRYSGAVLTNNNRTIANGRGISLASTAVGNDAYGIAIGGIYCVEFTIVALAGLLNIAPTSAYTSSQRPFPGGPFDNYAATSSMYFKSDGTWLVNFGLSDHNPGQVTAPAWVPRTKVGLVFDTSMGYNNGNVGYYVNGVLIAEGVAQYYTLPPWQYMVDARTGQVTVEESIPRMKYVYSAPGRYDYSHQPDNSVPRIPAVSWPGGA